MSVVIPRHVLPHAAAATSAPVLQSAANQTCIFRDGVDYHDPAGPVVTVKSREECCAACYTVSTGLPEPCVAAVFQEASGKCYLKLSDLNPINGSGSGITACVTNRESPKGYMFSWVNIYRVFDFLQSIHVRPVVELSFMPSLLASDPTQTGFWYRGGHSIPKSFDDWREFMSALVTALVDRYGLTEVEQWYFVSPRCNTHSCGLCMMKVAGGVVVW